jgi:hypothetical protein
MDIEPESPGALRHRRADAAHADNAQRLAAQAMAQHGGR